MLLKQKNSFQLYLISMLFIDEPPNLDAEETFGVVNVDEPSESFLGGLFDELGTNRRRARTSSVEEVPVARKRVKDDLILDLLLGGIADRIIAPLVQRQGSDISDVLQVLKTRKTDKEKNVPEEPKEVDIKDFSHEVDDANTVFASGVRNAIRPFCAPPKEYWSGVNRCVMSKFVDY